MSQFEIVFASEVDAGLVKAVRDSGSLDLTSDVKVASPLQDKATARLGVENASNVQFFTSVRACDWSGQDIIDPVEMWLAREHTKAILFDGTTVGYTLATTAFDGAGMPLRETMPAGDIPRGLRLVDSEVLLKTHDDKRVAAVLAEVANGGWSLSCQARFKRFDYILISPDGNYDVVVRTHDTAGLSKYLTAFGGPGVYEGRSIRRLLKYLSFSEKHLIRKEQPNEPLRPCPAQSRQDEVARAISAWYGDEATQADEQLFKSQADRDIAGYFSTGWNT